jgi:tRNA (adenine37-N6)-methyltransferase
MLRSGGKDGIIGYKVRLEQPWREEERTMKSHFVVLPMVLFVVALWPGVIRADTKAETSFAVHPIAHVQKSDGRTLIVLDKKYQPGLLGLDGFSHVHVIWWLDKNDTPEKRSILQVHPRGDPKNPLTGVFACRAPVRPNLIALSLCKIVSVKGNVVEVEKIDAFEGTPVLDLKPYAPGQDSATDAKVPDWAKPK